MRLYPINHTEVTYARFTCLFTAWNINLSLAKEYSFIIASLIGVINGTAPNPVKLAEMCDELGSVLGRPSWLPVPDFALKTVLGEGATVVRALHS